LHFLKAFLTHCLLIAYSRLTGCRVNESRCKVFGYPHQGFDPACIVLEALPTITKNRAWARQKRIRSFLIQIRQGEQRYNQCGTFVIQLSHSPSTCHSMRPTCLGDDQVIRVDRSYEGGHNVRTGDTIGALPPGKERRSIHEKVLGARRDTFVKGLRRGKIQEVTKLWKSLCMAFVLATRLNKVERLGFRTILHTSGRQRACFYIQ